MASTSGADGRKWCSVRTQLQYIEPTCADAITGKNTERPITNEITFLIGYLRIPNFDTSPLDTRSFHIQIPVATAMTVWTVVVRASVPTWIPISGSPTDRRLMMTAAIVVLMYPL